MSIGIPGIPQAALDAITDENARLVIQALADGMSVRNGFTGSKDERFLTAADLDRQATSGRLNLLIRNTAQQAASSSVSTLGPGMISRSLADLHTQVFESKLFHDLEGRVDLIDTPGGIGDRLVTVEAGLTTETTQRVNADNALQQTVTTQYAAVNDSLAALQTSQTTTANNVAALTTTTTTIQASVDTNSAAIQTEAIARAAADDTLYAQWTLRVDVNGRVSGFGLASSATSSDFIVRADRFSIVNPDGNFSTLVMSSNTLKVYDENGTLRVQIGNLA